MRWDTAILITHWSFKDVHRMFMLSPCGAWAYFPGGFWNISFFSLEGLKRKAGL